MSFKHKNIPLLCTLIIAKYVRGTNINCRINRPSRFMRINLLKNVLHLNTIHITEQEMCPWTRMPPLNVLCFYKRPITPSKISGL